jgi:2-oxoglutarate ferredoxin oxidoreductase subunit alpha
MDDYMSLIRGGHNFSVISTRMEEINSHYIKADLVVSLDSRSYELHKDHLKENGIHIFNGDDVEDGAGVSLPLFSEAKKYPNASLRLGVSGAAILSAAIGLDKEQLIGLIKEEYPKDLENNIAYAERVYDLAMEKVGVIGKLEMGKEKKAVLSGNEAIALGAAAAGLDAYFAYPMTPASSILHYYAAHDRELSIATVHPESEVGVANMAVGAAFAGARTMVGTSGGGFALMEEALSLAGMCEVPLMCVMSSRPGPSTGVPTYTEQADLEFALYQGHGEFPRLVASPGSIEEAFYLSGEMLNLTWKYQLVSTLLTEKHLSESRMTVELDPMKIREAGGMEWSKTDDEEYLRYRLTASGISPMLYPPSKQLIKVNSYEHDEKGITTEDPDWVIKMHDKRNRKEETLVKDMKKMSTVNRFGDEGPIIVTYGSTTMSVKEALEAGDLKARIVQPVFLRPFPVWEFHGIQDEDVIVVEQSSTEQFSRLIKEKTGVNVKKVIKRYDGRPFDPIELANELKEVF